MQAAARSHPADGSRCSHPARTAIFKPLAAAAGRALLLQLREARAAVEGAARRVAQQVARLVGEHRGRAVWGARLAAGRKRIQGIQHADAKRRLRVGGEPQVEEARHREDIAT